MGPATGKQKSRRTAVMSPRKMDGNRERDDAGRGVLAVAATFGMLRLIFANEFVEILKEADEDDNQRAGKPDEENPGEQGHSGMRESDHTRILMHVRKPAIR
jgi:hypothetical protein